MKAIDDRIFENFFAFKGFNVREANAVLFRRRGGGVQVRVTVSEENARRRGDIQANVRRFAISQIVRRSC